MSINIVVNNNDILLRVNDRNETGSKIAQTLRNKISVRNQFLDYPKSPTVDVSNDAYIFSFSLLSLAQTLSPHWTITGFIKEAASPYFCDNQKSDVLDYLCTLDEKAHYGFVLTQFHDPFRPATRLLVPGLHSDAIADMLPQYVLSKSRMQKPVAKRSQFSPLISMPDGYCFDPDLQENLTPDPHCIDDKIVLAVRPHNWVNCYGLDVPYDKLMKSACDNYPALDDDLPPLIDSARE